MFTTIKKDRDFVVYNKGLSFVGNATRREEINIQPKSSLGTT